MRAVLCEKLEGLAGMRLQDSLPSPTLEPGQVRIKVVACGVNFADTLITRGQYQEKPTLPFVPGFEVSGCITEIGAGVEGLSLGQRVLAILDQGGYADEAIALASDVFPIPDSMAYDIAAGFPIAYGTSHAALVWRAQTQADDIVLVHGAAGGVGLTAVEIAKALGAKVIATAGGADKLAVARDHGADALIDYREEDIRERVKEICAQDNREGVNVVYDPVGGDSFKASLRCVAWDARLVIIGFAAGDVPQIPANILLVKNIMATGLYWGSYRKRAPDMLRSEFHDLFTWFEAGQLKPHISHHLDLADYETAFDLLKTRKATGKVVLMTGCEG